MSKDNTIRDNDELLEEAAARNLSIELQQTESSGEFRSAKARLLAVDDQYLYLEAPTYSGKPVVFDANGIVDAYQRIHRKIYAFRSTVVRTDYLIKLNGGKRVQGIQITKPSDLKESQRRNTYRVSMASMAPVDVTLHEVGTMNPDTPLSNTKIASAQLVNLSSGGCGVVLPAEVAQRFQSGELVLISFDLPIESPPFVFQVRICLIAPILEGQAMRLGLQYVQWPDPARYGRMLRPLEKFIADAQRAEARRNNPRRD